MLLYQVLIFDSLVFVHGYGVYGGAININYRYDYGTGIGVVYLRNCIFSNNQASYGGAIASNRDNNDGTGAHTVKLKIYNSHIEYNSSLNDGGAIYLNMYSYYGPDADIQLEINNSNIMNNSANTNGGGIFAVTRQYEGWTTIQHSAYTNIQINKSSICNNTCGDAGGAIYASSSDNTNTLTSYSYIGLNESTLSNNAAISNGGAICNMSVDESTTYVFNSTVVYNTTFLNGSGLFNGSSTGTTTSVLSSSIIALNSGNVNYNNNIYDQGLTEIKASMGYNIFDNASLPYTFQSSDQYNVNASSLNLGPLLINSYATYTRIPLFGSVAINLGNDTDAIDAQNGPILGVRDIGAAESAFCDPIPVAETASICSGGSIS